MTEPKAAPQFELVSVQVRGPDGVVKVYGPDHGAGRDYELVVNGAEGWFEVIFKDGRHLLYRGFPMKIETRERRVLVPAGPVRLVPPEGAA